jgi:hypothetical protein
MTRERPGFPWEMIAETKCDLLQRMPVPGGWLYRTLVWNDGKFTALTVAMVFVPDAASERAENGL